MLHRTKEGEYIHQGFNWDLCRFKRDEKPVWYFKVVLRIKNWFFYFRYRPYMKPNWILMKYHFIE